MYRGSRYEMSYSDDVAELVIKQTEPGDAGKYRCEAANALGRVESTGKLTVHSK